MVRRSANEDMDRISSSRYSLVIEARGLTFEDSGPRAKEQEKRESEASGRSRSILRRAEL